MFRALRSALSKKELESWSKHISVVTPAIANFARKALLRCLPTNSNLLKWGRSATDSCPQCKNLETENHVLNNCSISAAQGRYSRRQEAVLRHLVSIIQTYLLPNDKRFADLEGYSSPANIFSNVPPDIVVLHDQIAFTLELTCCYERNFIESKTYKIQKYAGIEAQNCLHVATKKNQR